MVPALSLPFPFGSVAPALGGADLSYFVSFGVACALTLLLRRAGRKAGEIPPPV